MRVSGKSRPGPAPGPLEARKTQRSRRGGRDGVVIGFTFAVLASPAYATDPRFEPVTMPEHVYDGGWEHFVGGGLAAFDCSGDGLPELYAAGGSNPGTLMRNNSEPGGAIRFDAETPEALQVTGVSGAYPLDIDGDGILDLVLLRVGENMLMRGGPDCSFKRFETLDFDGLDRWTTAFSATWEAGNSLPTLAFGNYVNRNDPSGPFRACDVNHLYRPMGDRYDAPEVLVPGYCPLSMLFSDWGRRGKADLRVSNDRHYYVDQGEEQLWDMSGTPRLYGPEDGWQTHKLWGMGIAERDIDRDGDQDVFLTSMGDQRLQMLADAAAGPRFEDAPYSLGTTATAPYLGGDGRPSTGWHVAFGDVQNDGRDDIFITKGNVEQMPDSAWDDPNNLLVQKADGSFGETGGDAGLASLKRGRGGLLADLNRDGLLDAAVVNRRALMEVWQNVTAGAGHWLELELRDGTPNTRAVGAFIELDDGGPLRLREITVGGGHAGGSAVAEHFGLEDVRSVRLRVTWPDGEVSDWIELPADQVVTVRRGAGGALDVM